MNIKFTLKILRSIAFPKSTFYLFTVDMTFKEISPNISRFLDERCFKVQVKGQNLKVQINATDDTICMKYLRLSPDTKLQGFILGYGSSFFSNQYIPLPSEGKSYVTEVDAEPRYLITVRPAPIPNHKKTCSGKTKTQKPLQLVIGTLTPTSVYLSWGILVNPQHDWTAKSSCASDRFYTVRYREKDKNKNWGFQLCPTTETVVENLKPNTPYEFGVKDNTEDGIWSKIFNHKTILFTDKNKENGQLQNTYKVIPNIQTQLILRDAAKLVPITRIKEVIQNVTRRMLPKTTNRHSLPGAILVHLIIPGLNETPQQKLPKPETLGISETPKKILVTNETRIWPAESKTPEVQEISPWVFPATTESVQESIKPTVSAASEKSEASPAHSKNELESAEPSIAPMTELPLNTLAHSETDSGLEETKSIPKPDLAQTQNIPAFDETQFVSSRSKPSGVPEKLPTESVTIQTTPKPVTREASKAEAAFDDTHPVFSNPTTSDEPDRTDLKPAATSEPTLESFSPKTSSPLEWPRETLAPNEAPLIPSKLKPSPLPEVQHVKPAQKPPLLEHSTPKASKTIERPKTTLAPWETKFVPSTPKPSARPKMPRTKPAEKAIHLESNTPKFSNPLELPRTTLAPSKTKRIPSKPKVSLHPEEPKTKLATRKPVPVPVTNKISSITATTKTLEHPKSTMVSYEPQHIPSKPKASASAMPEMPHSKPESSEIHFTPLKPKSSTEPKMPQSKPAPTETQFIPSKPNTSPEPELPHPKPAPKETRRVPLKPKTSPKPHVPQTKPVPEAATFRTQQPKTPLAPKEARRVPSKPKTSPSPDVPQAKPAPKEVRRVPSKPKTSPIPDVPPTKPAAKDNRRVPSKPKTSPSPDVPQTKSAPHKVRLTSARPKIFDKPQTRPALNKTTPGPGRTKTAGAMKWGGTPTGDKETVQNFTNFLMGTNISLESNITWKNPDSVATAPDRRHPPLAPAKPTQVRRKPLPPNTVTGKPGSAGIALKSRAPPSPMTIVAKSTGPTISLKMETPRKKPTVSASPPEDYVNTTVFSSSPTSETDSLGKQRFTGPHVKYIPKNDSEPCSITRTLKYFQEKTISNTENVTSPPRNPPSNLTVVTVEGCPSFVVLNWTKPENDTVTYYVVLSTVNGTSNGTQTITITTKQTHCIVENLEPNKSYEFQVKGGNTNGTGPSTPLVSFSTESADPKVSEPISMGKDAIWTEVPFNSNSYSECKGKQYVKRTWYKKFVGVQLCNSLRYKIYLSDSLTGQFYDIGDERGHGEDHCQFVDSFLDGRTGQKVFPDQLPPKDGKF
uniref:ABI family member 3 binding protein n=1 Tax=Chrysemys picta bellii TaxID=8478 RepID=A0A8C3F9S8_CHRPI